MKNIKLSFLFWVFIVSIGMFSSCTTPADYCENVIGECMKLEKSVNKLSKQIEEKNYSEVNKIYEKNLSEINGSIEYLTKIGPCQDKTYLQEAALNFANTYKEIYEEDFKTAIEILLEENHKQSDKDIITYLSEEVTSKSQNARENLLENFRKFVQEFDLTVAN